MSDQYDSTSTRNPLTIDAIAVDFGNRDYTPTELAAVRRTRRRSPRFDEAATRLDDLPRG